MKAVILRPLAIFTCTYFAFSCYLFTADTAERLLSAVVFLSALILSLILKLAVKPFRKRSYVSATATAVCFLLAGAALASIHSHKVYSVDLKSKTALADKEETVTATVTEKLTESGYYGLYNVQVDETRIYGTFKCRLTAYVPMEVGDRIEFSATFRLPSANENYDERRYLLSDGITLVATADRAEVLSHGPPSFTQQITRIRESLRNIFLKALGNRNGRFVSALLLGTRSDIDKTVRRDFSRLGISHILAISGMHLSIICAISATVFGALSRRLKKPVCICTVIFYMLITGFSPSIMRAGIMLLLMIAASLFKRSADSFTNLGVSVFIICITDPYASADIGLQLSFFSVMALLLLLNKRNDIEEKTPSRLTSALTATFSPFVMTVTVVLFLLPLEWLYFGTVSLISPLTSPLFSLLATFILWLSPFLLLTTPAPTFFNVISYILNVIIDLVLYLSSSLSQLRGITASIDNPLAPVFVILIFLAVIIFCVTKKKKKLISGAVLAVLVLSFGISCALYRLPGAQSIAVSMENHKDSDAIVITSENRAMIIDIGNGYMPILRQSLERVKDEGLTEIEVLMLTHVHNSHPSTIQKLLENNIIRTVMLPDNSSPASSELIDVCKSLGVKVKIYEYGADIPFGDAIVQNHKPLFIDRSVQPIINVCIVGNDERFDYYGGGYAEAIPDADLTTADHIWFGTHGPLYKEEFSPATSLACRIYVSEKDEEYINAADIRSPRRILLGE